jgi:hypothetical protein
MGGQACVFYGAAQVSKDIDFLILAEEENFRKLQNALDELQAKRIAIPPFLPEALKNTTPSGHCPNTKKAAQTISPSPLAHR